MPAASSGWFLFLSIPIRIRIPISISICLPPSAYTLSHTHTRENSTLCFAFYRCRRRRVLFSSVSWAATSSTFSSASTSGLSTSCSLFSYVFPPLSASRSLPLFIMYFDNAPPPSKQLNQLLEKPVDGDWRQLALLFFVLFCPVRRLLAFHLCQFFSHIFYCRFKKRKERGCS